MGFIPYNPFSSITPNMKDIDKTILFALEMIPTFTTD